MKFELPQVQSSFDLMFRRQSGPVWDRLQPIVAFKRIPFSQDVPKDTLSLDFDLDAEVADDRVDEVANELTNRAALAADKIAQLPGILMVRALLGARRYQEVTVPAGCDPLDPAEIRSAFKRAINLGDLYGSRASYTLAVPMPSFNAFLDALDGPSRPTIDDVQVSILPVVDLVDREAMAELIPADGETTAAGITPDYQAIVLGVARRSPWFVIPQTFHNPDKSFEYRVKTEPHLVGPKLQVEWASELALREDQPLVKVSPSSIFIAQAMPRAA